MKLRVKSTCQMYMNLLAVPLEYNPALIGIWKHNNPLGEKGDRDDLFTDMSGEHLTLNRCVGPPERQDLPNCGHTADHVA